MKPSDRLHSTFLDVYTTTPRVRSLRARLKMERIFGGRDDDIESLRIRDSRRRRHRFLVTV